MWDRMVEAAAPGCTPEQVRRAALAVGWAIRRDAVTPGGGGLDPVDAARERWMRGRVAAAGDRRVAAVVGAFHAPALLGGAGPSQRWRPDRAPSTVVTSLVPYAFDLLDSRSGYPAGIRDPQWQQDVYERGADPAALEQLAVAYCVRVSAALRAAGHPAGPAEAREAARLAIDLARLRGLPAPGRGELVEAIETVLAHGEVLGRGRAVAAAMQEVFVGTRHGRLAPGTPESGLVPAVIARAAQGPPARAGRRGEVAAARPAAVHIGPSREVLLRRLAACGVHYGEVQASGGIGETLTHRLGRGVDLAGAGADRGRRDARRHAGAGRRGDVGPGPPGRDRRRRAAAGPGRRRAARWPRRAGCRR